MSDSDGVAMSREVQEKAGELRGLLSATVTLQKAFRKLALIYHPDRGGKPKDFKNLHQAFERLKEDLSVPQPPQPELSNRTITINQMRQVYPIQEDWAHVNVHLRSQQVNNEARELLAKLLPDPEANRGFLTEFDIGLYRLLFGTSFLNQLRWFTHRDDELFLLAVVMRIYFVQINDGKQGASQNSIYSITYRKEDIERYGFAKLGCEDVYKQMKGTYFSKHLPSCIVPQFVISRFPIPITQWYCGSAGGDFALQRDSAGMEKDSADGSHFSIFSGLQFDGSQRRFDKDCPVQALQKEDRTFEAGELYEHIKQAVDTNEANGSRPASFGMNWLQRLLVRDFFLSGRNLEQFVCLSHRQSFEYRHPHQKITVCTIYVGKQGTFKSAMVHRWKGVVMRRSKFCVAADDLRQLTQGGSSVDNWFLTNCKRKLVHDVNTSVLTASSKEWLALKPHITDGEINSKKLYSSIKKSVKDIATVNLLCNEVGAMDRIVRDEGKDQRRYHLVQVCGKYAKGGELEHLQADEFRLALEVVEADQADFNQLLCAEEKRELREKQERTAHNYAYVYKNLALPPQYTPRSFPAMAAIERTPEQQAMLVGTDLQKFLVAVCSDEVVEGVTDIAGKQLRMDNLADRFIEFLQCCEYVDRASQATGSVYLRITKHHNKA